MKLKMQDHSNFCIASFENKIPGSFKILYFFFGDFEESVSQIFFENFSVHFELLKKPYQMLLEFPFHLSERYKNHAKSSDFQELVLYS